ncbi:hypothetical protein BHM03_00022302 [Ensete ventricosum]|nr:hypothetical protein BHM03_00022302 [Ensete ventricosum]
MMAFGDREEIRVLVDGRGMSSSCSPAAASMCLCRICHEEEEERSTTMESPCACSGTLKRWCDEKGSTVCEICLQFISDNNSDFECAEVSPASRRHASYIRSIALMRDPIAVLLGDAVRFGIARSTAAGSAAAPNKRVLSTTVFAMPLFTTIISIAFAMACVFSMTFDFPMTSSTVVTPHDSGEEGQGKGVTSEKQGGDNGA